MMKKTLSILIVLVLCISMLSALQVQAATVKITSPQQFIAEITKNPSGDFELGADLDFSEISPIAPITDEFSGRLNGNGYTISGLVIGYSDNLALFKKVSGEISNIFIKDAKINLTSHSTTNVGLLAGELSGTIKKVVIDAQIKVNSAGTYAGGICSRLKRGAKISDCEVNGSIEITSTSDTTFIRVGGIAAHVPKPTDAEVLGKDVPVVSNCTNNMAITAKDDKAASFYAGGIVAFSESYTEITACKNTGDIKVLSKGASYAGGICAITASYTTASRCENVGNITAQYVNGGYESYSGGIVGSASGSAMQDPDDENKLLIEGANISNCANYGNITADSIAGGIVGHFSSRTMVYTFSSPDSVITADKTGRIYANLSYCEKIENNYSEFSDEYEKLDFKNIWTLNSAEPHVKVAGIQKRPAPPVTITFSDVKEKDWFYPHVQYALTHKIFSGKSAQNFAPLDKMTRAEFVAVLANLERVDTSVKPDKSEFSDVKLSDWYASAVMWASKNNIVSGYDGQFKPNNTMTRQEMCVMLINYVEKYKKIKPEQVNNQTIFADDAKIASWAKNQVYTCQKSGFVSGKGEGKFDPLGTALRCEVAALFKNFHEKYM